MKTRQITALIKSGKQVKLYSAHWNETINVVVVSQTRYRFSTKCGGLFEKDEFEYSKEESCL